MANRPIVRPSTVSAMLSLLDWLYHRGVEDAYHANDEGLCREYLNAVSKGRLFSTLAHYPVIISWEEWALQLIMQARTTAWNGIMSKFLNAAGRYKQNYLSVFYVIALEWYKKGVMDYISAPNADNIALFSSKRRAKWTSSGIKNISPDEYVDAIQLQCFEAERFDESVREGLSAPEVRELGLLPPQYYAMFRRAIGLAASSKRAFTELNL